MADSAAEAMGAPVVRTIEGKELKFGRLTMVDYASLESLFSERRAARLNALLNMANVTGPEKFVALRDGQPEITYFDIDAFLLTRTGADRALDLALTLVGQSADLPTARKLNMVDASNLARELCGFLKPKDASKPDDKGEKPPL